MEKIGLDFNIFRIGAISARMLRLYLLMFVVSAVGMFWLYIQQQTLNKKIAQITEQEQVSQSYFMKIESELNYVAYLGYDYLSQKREYIKLRGEGIWKNKINVYTDSLKNILVETPDEFLHNKNIELRKSIAVLQKSWNEFCNLSLLNSATTTLESRQKIYDKQLLKTIQIIQEINLHQQSNFKNSLSASQDLLLNIYLTYLLLLFLQIFIGILISIFVISRLLRVNERVHVSLNTLLEGNIPKPIQTSILEMKPLVQVTNNLADSFERLKRLAQDVGASKFDTQVRIFADKGMVGNAIAGMRQSLLKIAEQNIQRNWYNEGYAKFGELLRQSTKNPEDFFDEVISNLVNYLDINQGGIFVLNTDTKVPVMELKSCYAFQRKKFLIRNIAFGEGLVGQVWRDRDTIYITDIPEGYAEINSGLGKAKAKSLLITPLISDEAVIGILELASFEDFPKYKIELIKSVCESIAVAVSKLKIDTETRNLLSESQLMAEKMRIQEDLMRQNMEELMVTQEKMAQNSVEMRSQLKALEESFTMIEMDTEGKFIKLNTLLLAISGFEEEDLIGNHFTAMQSKKTVPEIAEQDWKTILSGNFVKGEFVRYTKEGKKFWLYEVIYPLYNSKKEIFKICSIGYDITKQKEQEQKIKEQLNELQMSKRDVVNRIREVENKAKIRLNKIQMELQEQLREKDRIIEELKN